MIVFWSNVALPLVLLSLTTSLGLRASGQPETCWDRANNLYRLHASIQKDAERQKRDYKTLLRSSGLEQQTLKLEERVDVLTSTHFYSGEIYGKATAVALQCQRSPNS